MDPRQREDHYWWGFGKIYVGYGGDRTKDDVTPDGKYFIMLEEETVGRLTKYIDMQDNYMENGRYVKSIPIFWRL